MATEFHNPISQAIAPESTPEAVSRYRSGQESGGREYASTVTTFYDLITDFYEFGWGRSFHFAPAKQGSSFEEALAAHQRYLGEAMGLEPGMKVLDVGCGVGGPQRSIAGKFGVSVVGLNISEYQLVKCTELQPKRRPRPCLQRRAGRFPQNAAGGPGFRRGLPYRGHHPFARQDGSLRRSVPDPAAWRRIRRLRLVHDTALQRR